MEYDKTCGQKFIELATGKELQIGAMMIKLQCDLAFSKLRLSSHSKIQILVFRLNVRI